MLHWLPCHRAARRSHSPGCGPVYLGLMIGTLTLAGATALPAAEIDAASIAIPPSRPGCLDDGSGFLQARLSGSVQAELTWQDAGLQCSGGQRPEAEGLRLRFSHVDPQHGALVIVLGMPAVPTTQARELPVNLTLIREGRGEFYSTQGDDKCMLDELRLTPLPGQPQALKAQGRGFCIQPARAVRGDGAVLMSRFDFAGRIDLDADTAQPISTLNQHSAPLPIHLQP